MVQSYHSSCPEFHFHYLTAHFQTFQSQTLVQAQAYYVTDESLSRFKTEALKIAYINEQDVKMLPKFHASFVNHWKVGYSFRSTN